MELKQNFTRELFLNSLKQQAEIESTPTPSDAIGDSFANTANKLPAQGPAQRKSAALMSGISGGVKAAANADKRERLSPIMQQISAINAHAAKMEAEAQDAEEKQVRNRKFLNDNAVNLANFSQAHLAGDKEATNTIAKHILQNAKSTHNLQHIGAFDHVNEGTIYYENLKKGQTDAINIADLIAQSGVNPMEIWGDNAASIMAGLSAGAKAKYENTEEATKLALEKERAGIAKTQSDTNLHDAQRGKLEHEMKAPKPKYSDKVLSNITTENTKWVNELRDKHRRLEKEEKAYNELAKIFQTETSDKYGRAGSSLLAKTQRTLNKSNTQSEKNQALAELRKQPLMQGLKEVFSGATSDKDIELFVEGLPSLDKNPEASIAIAQERASEINRTLQEDRATREVLENEFGFAEPYNSLAVQNRVQEQLPQVQQAQAKPESSTEVAPQATSTEATVRMRNAQGDSFDVPQDKIQVFRDNGYEQF